MTTTISTAPEVDVAAAVQAAVCAPSLLNGIACGAAGLTLRLAYAIHGTPAEVSLRPDRTATVRSPT